MYVNQKYTDLKAVYWQHHARLGAPSLVHDMYDLGYRMSECTISFFHTLKGHVVHGSVFTTRKEANAVLFEYIEIYYNRIRRHSANGWLSPEAFEQNYFKNLEGLTVCNIV